MKSLKALCILACSTSFAQSNEIYEVGVAVKDITPDYPIRLNGFGNRRAESEGVSQQIFAKAMAISQGAEPPLVLVTLDSLGIRTPMADEVAKRLSMSHRLPRQNLAITFTHTHCAPKVNGASDNIFSTAIPSDHQQHIDRYTRELTDWITVVARRALDARKPSRLQWSVGSAAFAKNRRTVGGPVDHDLPMLVVRDSVSDRIRAVYVSYACHCVTLSFNKISGDWAGYAAAMIERRIPGAVALVSIGAGSDQNPISGVTGDGVQVAEGQGVEIATEVDRLLTGQLRTIEGQTSANLKRIPLPLQKLPTREELQAQTQKGRPTDRYNATTQLARLDRGEKLQSEIDYSIQTWSFGESFCMTFLAGEVCVDYALQLKKRMDKERFWLNAYSNDFCCYIPSERLVKEGGYGGGAEVPYFALPATLKSGLEQLILNEVHRQVPGAFQVSAGTQGVAPKEPHDSLKCMTTHPHLEIALAASEPQISDPVCIDFGPDGRLWVAEMNDYGRGVYESFEHSGRIRWLRDNDNDGFFEEAKTFVDGLRFPTDVKIWRKGILICDAPDILFAEDTTGDGVADSVKKLFSGFEVRNAQARVNSLRFGLDNWLYGACGLFGGKIKSHLTGQTIDCSNRDFRLNPDFGVIEPVSGRTQQGRCRNDQGDWFGCSNGTLLRSIPSDDRYHNRNPFAPPTTPRGVFIEAEASKLYPPDSLVTFELSGAPGRATAACGLGIYRDEKLGMDYRGDAFTCEPVHQSVHRIDFSPMGHGFKGQRGSGEESTEFLSSTDRWFRPVQARTGPDGALWVVDMYRYVIEHSRWIPQETLAELNVHAGSGRGRIFRILPADHGASESGLIPDLSGLTTTELVARLADSNGVIRDLAHQMLYWDESGSDCVPLIQSLINDARTSFARIHALAVLQGLDRLKESDLMAAFGSKNADVLRFAVGLTETIPDISPELQAAVASLATHENVRVRRQVAFAAGSGTSDAMAKTVVDMLSEKETDVHVHSAALNSVSTANLTSVLRLYNELSVADSRSRTREQLHLLAIRIGDNETVSQVLQNQFEQNSKLTSQSTAFWSQILNALDRRATSEEMNIQGRLVNSIRDLNRNAMEILKSNDQSEDDYLMALPLLGRRFGKFTQSVFAESDQAQLFEPSNRAAAIAALVSTKHSARLQREAIHAIANTGAPNSSEVLTNACPSLTVDNQVAVVDVLLNGTGGSLELLKAIDTGKIRRELLDATRRAKLLASSNPMIKSTAEKVLSSTSTASRSVVVNSMQGALELTGDADSGRVVFRKRCSSCHRLENHGYVVGPDLKALTNRDPKWLLTAMLDPNKEVDARYVGWTAVTDDGRTAAGMIVEETATTIRLRESGGKEHVVPRMRIEEFRSTQRSVMPEGLERDMSLQEFSDVIAFLTSIEPPPKQMDGNRPEVVTPNADGILALTASKAEIRGLDIRFEPPFANLGYWHHQGDTATWKLRLPMGGKFDVYINSACASASAGNAFQIEGMSQEITGTVISTGGWDRYRQKKIGTAELSSGSHVVTVRPDGPVKNALFDLRELRLVPENADPKFQTADIGGSPLPRHPPQIAPFLLDESLSTERRQAVIDQRPGMGPAIISLLAADLKPGDLAEEYRRTPWIWRVAIAVGKRNDGGEIRDVLEACVPKPGQPLSDWQAVVIGGGIINGISQHGLWPQKRLGEILEGIPSVKGSWPGVCRLAAEMADNEKTKPGTRYDALRMVALQGDPTAVTQLRRYLTKGTSRQLQMGAVSGLVDVDNERANDLLIESLAWLEGRNRFLAIEGLLRTRQRAFQLDELIRSGKLSLTSEESKKLREHAVPSIRQRAAELPKSE